MSSMIIKMINVFSFLFFLFSWELDSKWNDKKIKCNFSSKKLNAIFFLYKI
jgi:hypothetical protein